MDCLTNELSASEDGSHIFEVAIFSFCKTITEVCYMGPVVSMMR